MSIHTHLSDDLYTLITKIAETSSREEESLLIKRQITHLKDISSEAKTIRELKELLIRGIYFEILGFKCESIYISAINLSQSRHLTLKKIGYMTSSLFLREEDEISILIISSMQKDLASKDEDSVIAALNCFNQMGFPLMAQALYSLITGLTSHKNLLIRKKSHLAIWKMRKISPNLSFNMKDIISRALRDKSLGISSVGLILLKQEEEIEGKNELIEPLINLLSNILNHTHVNNEYDYHRIPAPWMQISILKLITKLLKNSQISPELEEILKKCLMRNSSTGTNIGNSVAYQTIVTIATLCSSESLIDDACSSLNVLLMSDNPNYRILGVKGLLNLVQRNQAYAIEHQLIIVDCLESRDDSLKRETLKLLFSMANFSNLEAIVSTLLKFLKSEENMRFKDKMINQILEISEKYASSQSWFLSTMKSLIEIGHDWISVKTFNSFISLVNDIYCSNPEETAPFICRLFCEEKKEMKDPLSIKLTAWIIGEIGSRFYQGEEKLEELVLKLNTLLSYTKDEVCQSYIVSSFLKCRTKLEEAEKLFNHERISKNAEFTLLPMRLSNFSMGLMDSTQVEADPEMKFLRDFVESEKESGSREYKRPEGKIIVPKTESYIRLESYSTKRKQNEKDSETFHKKVERVWGPSGYSNKISEKLNQLPFSSTKKTKSPFLTISEKQKSLQAKANSLFSNSSLFEGMKFKHSKFQSSQEKPEPKNQEFIPHEISTMEFESLWDNLKSEKILELKTIIKNSDAYSAFLSRAGFHCIEVIDGEIISSSIFAPDSVTLLYGRIHENGNLELRLKSQDPNLEFLANLVVGVIMKYFKPLD